MAEERTRGLGARPRIEFDRRRFLSDIASCRRIALDTNSCLYFLEPEPQRAPVVSEVILRAASGPLEIELSGVVLMELLIHPHQSGDIQELNRIRRFAERQKGVTTVDVSRGVAFASAAMRAITGLKLPDAVIAGSAAFNGCDAIVGNDGNFRRLTEHQTLRVISLGAVLRMPRYIHIDDYVRDTPGARKVNA